MRVHRSLLTAFGAVALALAPIGAAHAATATTSSVPGAAVGAVKNPCGFYKTGSDAFYHHCTNDGSHVIIKVDANWAPDYERCVYPGETWLGAANKINGAWYTGRTC
ncbi:DUF6355 family natural product biosynthesis protein [Streptomyces sp. NBC_00237]|uniref:DUF6355 family natural product biosynthesis protein n=1 Tax=Streptomyces sp. NBC_00237 TaxID=2975687 RepID=UPI00225A851F|nr:DUF6355 family natural product biosynthesis protein [Streptomyces sp. NBC_00237]MCX5202786.1 DUF6355 family natural product biosynthesis protein [Streptomyces sp. NBC_00237]